MKNGAFVMACLMGGGLAAAATAEPLAVFECREITGRDWPRTMVTYEVRSQETEVREQSGPEKGSPARVTLAGPVKPDAVRLVDTAASNEVPFQFWRVKLAKDGTIESARIFFYAALTNGGAYRFELLPGKSSLNTEHRTLNTSSRGGVLTVDNGITGIRLPAGKQTFEKPLRFARDHAEAAAIGYDRLAKKGLAFGPIAGIRLNDGTWVGGSYFTYEPIEVIRNRQNYQKDVPTNAWDRAAAAAPTVTACETVVTEQGPLFVEARTRFELSNGGYYQLTARVLAGDAAVRIDEESQLKSNCPPDDPLYVDMILAGGKWKPDSLFAFGPKSEKVAGMDEALKAQGFRPTLSMLPVKYDGEVVTEVLATSQWQQQAQFFGLVNVSDLAAATSIPWSGPLAPYVDTAKLSGTIPILTPGGTNGYPTPDARFLAVVPQHAGTWRQAHWVFPPKNPHMFQQLFSYPNGDVAMRWSIRPQPHSQSVLHTGEFDPDFGMTGMRRLWNLVTGPFQYNETLFAVRAYEGYVNLDAYKNWTLAWSDDTRAGVALPPVPSSGPLGHFNMSLRMQSEPLAWFSHYRQSENLAWANEVRKQLADPTLTAAQKGQLRAQVAAFCGLMADPDFNMRASMLHQGNPNMPINRFFALPFAAALIPDHPMAKTWMDTAAAYVRYKAGMNTAPGGAWSELITYYAASAPTLVHGALVVQETGRLEADTRQLVLGPVDFTLGLLAPTDPRIGIRLVPGFGHEGFLWFNHWLPAAALGKDSDPARAALYAWAWKEQGKPGESQHCNGFANRCMAEGERAARATPEKVRQALVSRAWPGFGAVLRNAGGDPMETYLGYRQGYLASHSDANQGDFVLYAKGAPLTLNSMYGYSIHQRASYKKLYDEFGWHSRVRFGEQKNVGGWPGGGPVSGVHRHFFSDSVDYLKGVGDYGPVPAGKLEPDEVRQRWSRQVLFLKGKTPASPNYFVFRDSFRHHAGDAAKLERTWWYQRVLGKKEQVLPAANGFEFASEFNGVKLNTRFLQPASVVLETRDATEPGGFGAMGMGGSQGLGKDKPVTNETITVVAAGPIAAGQDVFVAVMPRGSGEPEPKYEALADGVARITTTESTDYVFAGVGPVKFQQGDVTFEGIAGAIRVYPDAVHLVVAEGTGTANYKGYTLKAGKPATKVVPVAEIAKGGTVEVPADKVTITFGLDPKEGEIREEKPGVRSQKSEDGMKMAWEFNSVTNLVFDSAILPPSSPDPRPLRFAGCRGGIVVDAKAGTVRLVMLDGEKISYGDAQASEGSGPYDLTFLHDKVVGVTEGPVRFIHVTMPKGIIQLPALNIKGVRYAPGTYGNLAIIPVEAGRFEFTLENLPQPPVFREWLRW